MTFRNALAAALLGAAAIVTTAGGAASAVCEPLTQPVCPGTIRDPRDIECWSSREEIPPRVWCEW